MKTTIQYILLTAFRDWLFAGLAVALLAIFGIAHFLGSNAVVEQQQMTLVYVSSSTRLLLSLGLIVFIVFHIRRMFEHREIDVILTRPIKRETVVFAFWMGYSIVSVAFVAVLLAAMYLILSPDLNGLLIWGSSVLCEALIITAFAVFTGLVLKSAVSSVLLAYGFYLVARMAGFFLYFVDPEVAVNREGWNLVMQKALLVISWVVPRLDQFGQSEWLVYGTGDVPLLFPVLTAVYVPFLLLLAIIDFKRKQF